MARRPLRPDDLWLLRTAADPRWSPDGRHVAFVVGTHRQEQDRLEQSIWLAEADGGAPARLLAAGPTSHTPRFSPDGSHLAFLSDRGDGVQLHLAPLSGGDPRPLTSLPHGVSAPAWSPDGRRLAFVAKVGEAQDPDRPRVVRSLRSRVDGFGWLDDRRSHVFVVDVEKGTRTQVTDGDWDDEQPAWSPDGRHLAFVSDRGDERSDRAFHRDVWMVASTGGRARRLTRGRGDAMAPAFSPSGDRVAYLGGEDGDAVWSRPTQLLVVDLARGRSEGPRSLTAAHDVHAGSRFLLACQLAWVGDDRLLFLGPQRGGIGLFSVDADGTAVEGVVGGDRSITGFDVAGDGRVAVASTWIDEPPEIWVADPGSDLRRLTAVNDELRRTVRLARGRRVRSRAADGRDIESFLVRPPALAAGATPSLVLDIHGGPHGWNPGTSVAGWWAVQAAASAGHAVLLPNPRGSAGYGADFLAACVGDWGGGDADDLLGAADAVLRSGAADPARQYVWGYSFGGFMTAWLVGHTDRFRAAVVGAPVTDLASMLGTTDIPAFTLHEVGGLPWERPDDYAKHSPITYAADIRTPTLVLHHDGDLRCPIGQGEQLFVALRLAGTETEMVRYPGGSHGVARPSFVIDRAQRLVDWFATH